MSSKDSCDGDKIHETTEHCTVEKVIEKLIPNMEQIHKDQLEKDCNADKLLKK